MEDLISRQAAIDAIRKDMYADKDYMSAMICDGIESVLRGLPSVQEQGKKLDEWCDGCREYDQERHCCPRWNRVIRNTVEELKAERWIPVTERLPRDDEDVIVTCLDDSGDTPFSYTTVAWHYKGMWVCDNERCLFVTAWMPMPDPYKGEE